MNRTVDFVHLRVAGKPAPKGSSRAFMNKHTGKAQLAPSGSRENEMTLRDWKQAVINACHTFPLPHDHPRPIFDADEPLAIAMIVRVPMRQTDLLHGRPRKTARALAATGRDFDKLERSTWDAVTQSGRIWVDDSRVAAPHGLRRYVQPGQWLGAEIVVSSDVGRVIKWHYDQWKAAEAEFAAAREAARLLAMRGRRSVSPNQPALL